MERVLSRSFKASGEPLSLAEYEAAGGYSALRKALRMEPEEVLKEVLDADVRGRGGAGYPAGKKWSALPDLDKSQRPRLLFVNLDEMEPGTFKDRYLVQHNPHQLIEGALIAAYAAYLELGYIFVRASYVEPMRALEGAMREAAEAGYVGGRRVGGERGFELHLHASAGRYICGDAMGLLNAMQGERGIPRTKPPHSSQSGAWGKPSIVNNVETLCCVPHVIERGADWFRNAGIGDDTGPKIYGISGRVNRPGSYELPLGTTLRNLIDHAGGMQEGYGFKAALPGGASTRYLDSSNLDANLGFAGLEKIGAPFGTGSCVVIDDRTCIVSATRNLQQFFARESCGWCTPCRDGLPWLRQLLDDIEEGRGQEGDLELLAELTHHIHGQTFCLLAVGAAYSIESGLDKFRDEFDAHIKQGGCPMKAAPGS